MITQFPAKFGDYTLLELIGVGGMAEVYRGVRRSSGSFEKPVAVKMILPHLAENDDFITMLTDEARLLVSISHPNVAQVYDFRYEKGRYFIALEFVNGTDLSTLAKIARQLDGHPFPIDAALYVLQSICAGLHAAHSKVDDQGRSTLIVHRDVSPHNVLISYTGEVKLIDFGVAKIQTVDEATRSGVIKGKLHYMAPEQARGGEVDGRSDLFAAGILCYELLTGQLPFDGESEYEIYNNLINKVVEPPSRLNPDVPPDVDHLILRMLERDPNRRFRDGLEIRQELDRILYNFSPGYTSLQFAAFIESIVEAHGPFRGEKGGLPVSKSPVRSPVGRSVSSMRKLERRDSDATYNSGPDPRRISHNSLSRPSPSISSSNLIAADVPNLVRTDSISIEAALAHASSDPFSSEAETIERRRPGRTTGSLIKGGWQTNDGRIEDLGSQDQTDATEELEPKTTLIESPSSSQNSHTSPNRPPRAESSPGVPMRAQRDPSGVIQDHLFSPNEPVSSAPLSDQMNSGGRQIKPRRPSVPAPAQTRRPSQPLQAFETEPDAKPKEPSSKFALSQPDSSNPFAASSGGENLVAVSEPNYPAPAVALSGRSVSVLIAASVLGILFVLLASVGTYFYLLPKKEFAALPKVPKDVLSALTGKDKVEQPEPGAGAESQPTFRTSVIANPTVELTIESRPSGAIVTLNDVKLGETPLVFVTDKSDDEIELQLALDKYKSSKVALTPSEDVTRTVVMSSGAPRPTTSAPKKGDGKDKGIDLLHPF